MRKIETEQNTYNYQIQDNYSSTGSDDPFSTHIENS